MASKKKKRFYAYHLGDEHGIVGTWSECESIVSGRKARYRGFVTRGEAQAWLAAGALYEDRAAKKAKEQRALPEEAVYFDAGTGGGRGTEVNVTDRDGVPMVHMVAQGAEITPQGTVLLVDKTNNYGELLACLHAMQVARQLGLKLVFGDSRLVLDYWSKNYVSAEKRTSDPDLVSLVRRTARERKAFEADGGELRHVSGGINPADLGFHRD